MKKFLRPFVVLWGALVGFARRKPKLCTIMAVALVIVVSGGLIFSEMQARKKRTLAYANSQINQALTTKDMALLATYVDLDAIAASFASSLERTPGLLPPAQGADLVKNRKKLHETVLNSLNEVFKGTEVKAPPARERSRFLNYLDYRGPIFEDLKPPPVLPADLLAQITGRLFTVQGQDGGVGILSTPVEHPAAGISTRLRLLARSTPDGWKVSEIANAQEVLDLYKKALDEYTSHREAVFHALNARIREVMSAHCYILMCNVVVEAILPDGTVKLIVQLEGTNIGKNTMMTAGIRVKLFDSEDKELTEIPLGLSNRVPVGTSFRQHYNLELNWPPELLARIKPLEQLAVAWEVTAVSLDNQLFLFPKPIAELNGTPS